MLRCMVKQNEGNTRWPSHGRAQRPQNELGVVVPINLTLARTPDLIIALTHADVFTAGLTLHLSCRSGSTAVDENGRPKLIATSRPTGTLLFGVEFSDGRSATNMTGALPEVGDPEQPLLQRATAHGSSSVDDRAYYLTPLPPPGPMTVLVAAPLLDIPDHRHQIDTTAFRDAHSRTAVLWPEPLYPQPSPPSYPIPDDSWLHGRPRDGRS